MSLTDAIIAAGPIWADSAIQSERKGYSEQLSKHLAYEVADGLRAVGFDGTMPLRGGPGEKAFQGGLGPKKVDVSYSDDQHGLMLAVSIKSINSPPFGKNLKNRFGDLLTESITLHLRFPYSIVCALFAFPTAANADKTKRRKISTFERARKLFATVSGRRDYTDPGEKFEDVTLLLFEPYSDEKPTSEFQLISAETGEILSEDQYFQRLREIYNLRNPHNPVGESDLEDLE